MPNLVDLGRKMRVYYGDPPKNWAPRRGVRKGVRARGSWPPMAARESTINNIIVSGEAILSDENCGKPA